MATAETEDLAQELSVVDCEVHTGESRLDLMEYLPEDRRRDEEAGYTFGPDNYGPIPWDGWDRSAGGRIAWDHFEIENAEAYEKKADQFGIDKIVYSPGPGFRISLIPDADVRVDYMRAENDYLVDNFARGDGRHYTKMFILGEHPEESAAEIERVGNEKGVVGIFMTDVGPTHPMGHRSYEPIYEAAEKYDLPIITHSTTGMNPGFPAAGLNVKNFLEWHTLSHPVAKMWHATSLVVRGIPEKYDVDFGFWEAGFSWIQLLMNRMDREYIERPNEAPDLEKLPSEYLQEFYYGSQPIPEPQNPEFLSDILRENGLDGQVVFTTDYPHMDFDAPTAVADHEGLTREQKVGILQDNARDLFDI